MSLRITDVWHSVGFSREREIVSISHALMDVLGARTCLDFDRVYASDLVLDRGSSVGILGGTCMSDHAPVLVGPGGGLQTLLSVLAHS